MSDQLTFQDMILRLQDYWAKTGCLLWQPYNTEVGAGTMNPATFLRVLGPEPWNVGYVEPSVRPDDSRYGENPNRIQMHTQYQVILKPDPGNPQELYLGSLEALGIDLSKNDVRFVEDNWESPALGAWGLGWEVWLNGLEITQFTYFQQAGGFNLDPVAVEITYGLERIIMALQGVDHFKKIIYAPGITYDEVLGQNEYEMSVYNLDAANVERVAQLFDLYEAEAKMLIEQRLPIPAYSYMLKTSHTFNILDARGAIGVTERQRYFQRMRDLARDVARLWLEKREEMGFPLGTITPPDVKVPPRPAWVLD
ncbi:glycine--tRNA ligase subunit alpha, partial [Ardenticatena maritima]